MNIEKIDYSETPIFWTNSSEGKPTRGYFNTKIVWVKSDTMLAFAPKNNEYGEASLLSKNGNLTYIKWYNGVETDFYLVKVKIRQNNGNFKYFLEKDIWINIALPFVEKQSAIGLLRTSDSNENEGVLLEDSRINKIPLIYDAWKWKREEATTITKPIQNMRWRTNVSTYSEYSNNISLTISHSVSTNIYYVFDNTFAGLNEAREESSSGHKINDQPYVFVPVIGAGKWNNSSGGLGTNLNNTVAYLDSLTVKATNFIGVFKGPDLFKKRVNRNTNNPNISSIQFFIGSVNFSIALPILFMNGGDNIFAEVEVPVVSKYQKLIYENTNMQQNNYNINATNKNYDVIFNGAGFIAYKDTQLENTDIFNGNITDTTIDYGSFLPSLSNSYQTYINANKSQINAGIARSNEGLGVGITGSVIAGIGAALAIPSGGSSLALATIGTGIIGSIAGNNASKRQINAKMTDLKRSQSNNNQSTDIIDNIMVRLMNKSYNGTTPKIILSSYFVQSLSSASQNLINEIYDKFGYPTTKISSYKELETFSINNKWCYFEINLSQFEYYIQETSDYNQLEKELIQSLFQYGIRLINE